MADKYWLPRQRTTFAGAGPHAVTTPLFDCIVVTPGGGLVAVVNLPAVADASVMDGEWLTVVNNGTGADMVLLVPNGAETIGGATHARIFQKGSLSLQINQTISGWNIVQEVKGYPETIQITASSTGNDNNPGTAALPVLTVAKAFERLGVEWTGTAVGSADVVISGAYADANVRTVALPGPKPGSGGAAPRLIGSAQVDAGFGVITVTGGTASTASNFRTVTYAAVAALLDNAGADFFFRGLSGGVNGRRQPIKSTTTTVTEFIEDGAALVTGTFQIETPNSALSNYSFVPGTGDRLTVTDFDLLNCGFGRVNVTTAFCRMDLVTQGFGACGHTSTALHNTGSGQGYSQSGGSVSFSNLGLRNTLTGESGFTQATFVGLDDTPAAGVLASITLKGTGTIGTVKAEESSIFGVSMLDGAFSAGPMYINCPTNTVGTAVSISNAHVRMSDTTGDTGNALPQAVQAANGATVEVNAGVLINANGAANAVKVGANAVASWATIAGDLTADVFDGGAASGATGVSVRRTL